MTIKVGESPEGRLGTNKFIAKSGDGLRGAVVAIHESGKEAIILAMTSSLKGDVEWGRLYLVRETDEGQWPVVVDEAHRVPAEEEWAIVIGPKEL